MGLCKTGEWLTQNNLLICSISVRKTDGRFVWWILRHPLIYSIFKKKWDKALCLVDVQILHDFIRTRSSWSYRTSQANLHRTIESYMRKYVPSFSN